MSNKMSARLIVIGLVYYASAAHALGQGAADREVFQVKDYAMLSIETATERTDQSAKLRSVRFRLARRSGEWKQVMVSASGRISLLWSKPDGLYFGEPGNLFLRGEFEKPSEAFYSVQFLLSHKQFDRELNFLGYRTFVLREQMKDGGYSESYQSPAFGAIPVKHVIHLADGRESVVEAVKLQFGQVTDQMIDTEERLESVDLWMGEAATVLEDDGRAILSQAIRQILKRLEPYTGAPQPRISPRYSFGGKTVSWAGTPRGLIVGGQNGLQYYGDYDPETTRHPNASREAFMASPQFSRLDHVAGLQAYVMRDTSDAEIESEIWLAPETGIIPLKRVLTRKAGGRPVEVNILEAVGLEFRDVTNAEVRMPDLPLGLDLAARRAQSIREAGQPEKAEQIEEGIERQRTLAK